MKLKTINSIICRKFDAWLESIEDPVFKALAKDNTVCTGGAIASMLLNEDVNDFDLYFRDYETTKAAAHYYVARFKANPPPKFRGGHNVDIRVDEVEDREQAGLKRIRVIVKSAGTASSEGDEGYAYFEGQPDGEAASYIASVLDNVEEGKKAKPEKPSYRPVFLSTNAISLSDDVQIVVRFYGEPEQIHANYDYVHVTNYWTSWQRRVTVNQAALLSLMNKDLRYVGSRYPLCSLFRMRKFIKRGWHITAGQVLKMAVNLQKYNLLDIAVLEEQLTGVDVAYFNDLISRLQDKSQDTKVDEAYLAELIDKLF